MKQKEIDRKKKRHPALSMSRKRNHNYEVFPGLGGGIRGRDGRTRLRT